MTKKVKIEPITITPEMRETMSRKEMFAFIRSEKKKIREEFPQHFKKKTA